jgi:hypothetical protein
VRAGGFATRDALRRHAVRETGRYGCRTARAKETT